LPFSCGKLSNLIEHFTIATPSEVVNIPDYDEVFNLDPKFPEKNKGFIIFRPKNIREGKYCMEAYCIYRFYQDLNDSKNSEYFQAQLVEDGSGVAITEPALPYCFLHGHQEMKKAEHKTGVCESTSVEIEKISAAVIADKSRHKKTTLIMFPKDVKCCNDLLNGGNVKMSGNGNKLKTYGRFLPYKMDIGDKNANCIAPYVYWKLPIVDTVNLTDQQAAGHKDDVFNDAIESMLHL
jgi:hypothetical protein